MVKKQDSDLRSSAGLLRRYDVDERKNIQIRPGWVIAFPFIVVAFVVLVYFLVRWIGG